VVKLFQFFPSCCRTRSDASSSEIKNDLSILSQLLLNQPHAPALSRQYLLSILSQLLPLDAINYIVSGITFNSFPVAARAGLGAAEAGARAFNSFPVAAGVGPSVRARSENRRLSILSQLLPSSRPRATGAQILSRSTTRFQFFPSCCQVREEAAGDRGEGAFNSFPVAALERLLHALSVVYTFNSFPVAAENRYR